MRDSSSEIWRPFARTAVAMAAIPGFGLGGWLFLVGAMDRPVDTWWPAAAEAHGHVQLFGWAGLMVLGVGFHFLPRLSGSDPVNPVLARMVLLLSGGGILLRSLAGIALAADPESQAADALRVIITGSAAAVLVGTAFAVAALGKAVSIAAMRSRSAVAAILPLMALGFGSFLGAAMVNFGAAFDIGRGQRVLMSPRLSELSQLLMQYGFLLSVTLAMSARLFPLYVRTSPPSARRLRIVAGLIAAGLALRGSGIWWRAEWMTLAGGLIILVAVSLAVIALGIFAARRPLPRRSIRVIDDPLQLHVVTAYLWLSVAALASVVTLAQKAGLGGPSLSATVERHAFGAGFVTVMIVGIGQVLLPGFDKKTMKHPWIVWNTLALSNIAALTRVLPASGWGVAGHAATLSAIAGLCGMAAICCFAWNAGLFDRIAADGSN